MEIWNPGLPTYGVISKSQKHVDIISSAAVSQLILQDSVHFVSILLHFQGVLNLFSSPPTSPAQQSYLTKSMELLEIWPQSSLGRKEIMWGKLGAIFSPSTHQSWPHHQVQTDLRGGTDAYFHKCAFEKMWTMNFFVTQVMFTSPGPFTCSLLFHYSEERIKSTLSHLLIYFFMSWGFALVFLHQRHLWIISMISHSITGK